MSDSDGCGLAAETKVETPEGPMTIRVVAGKSIAVLTRDPTDGSVLFRAMRDVRKVSDASPVLKITLETGSSFRVAPHQILYDANLQPIAARDLTAGVGLRPAFHYPAGYEYQTEAGATEKSAAAWKVSKVEPAGNAEVFALGVNQTGCFFVSAGVLLKAE